jgi:hypothetical protein
MPQQSTPRAEPPQPPRFELPPAWEPGGPREREEVEWDDEADIPAAWLPDSEPATPEPQEAESARDLLQRLAHAAEAATRDASVREEPEAEPDEDAQAVPPPKPFHEDSQRLRQLRERLATPTSLREAVLIQEVLGSPRARRRRRFPG